MKLADETLVIEIGRILWKLFPCEFEGSILETPRKHSGNTEEA